VGSTRLPLTTRTIEQGPPLSYRAFVPSRGSDHPALVIVHGNSRRATRQFRSFLPGAIARGVALIAPTFPAGRFSGYQSLAGVNGAFAARQALLDTLDDASRHLRVPTDVIDMVGYSGGAQFAHRFAMHSPDRVGRVVLAAAGWYTYLDEAPLPVRDRARPAQRRPPGGRGCLPPDPGARRGRRARHRKDRRPAHQPGPRPPPGAQPPHPALRWMDHVEDTAQRRNVVPQVSFDLLLESGHSFDDAVRRGLLVERTFDFLHRPDPIRPATVQGAATRPAING
jgi:pimeloyl-ACP methyl ester carboxylesterase